MANNKTKKIPVGLTIIVSIIAIILGFATGLVAPLYAAENYFTAK